MSILLTIIIILLVAHTAPRLVGAVLGLGAVIGGAALALTAAAAGFYTMFFILIPAIS